MGHKSIVVMKAMAAAYAVTIALLFLVAFILYKTHLPEKNAMMMLLAVYVIANFVGAMICAKVMNQKRLLWGMITAALYFALLYVISMIVGGDQAKEMVDIVKMAVCCMLGGIVGSILS